LGVSDIVGITGPHPTVPQDDDVPCSATAAAGIRARVTPRPIIAMVLNIGSFPIARVIFGDATQLFVKGQTN
jgi:hypothetical protein